MGGRKAQPTDLLLAKGKKHLTKEEIQARKNSEIKMPKISKVTNPSYLSRKQKLKFSTISKQLIDLDIFAQLDRDHLAMYVIAHEKYLEATKALDELDIIKDLGNYTKIQIIQDKFFKQCKGLASDLGLNITSRCKLVIPKPLENPNKSEEEELFGDDL
ncbi:MAG: phage terminase small subunit P27 family [Streptococcaceae bacterium]|jgi:P27 family predicted phage terminase small subunit|nr:phage terminase small subunit P27 family [Streptococcaceae bacterium]